MTDSDPIKLRIEGYQRLASESQQVFLYEHDPEHRFTFVSPSVESVLGYTPAELIGQSYDILHADSRSGEVADEAFDQQHRQGAIPEAYPVSVYRNDGTLAVLELIEGALLDGENVVSVQGIAVDVTERVRAQEKLRASERRFRMLAENIQEVFWIATVSGTQTTMVYISPAYETIWGRPRAEAMEHSRAWVESVHPEDQALVYAELERYRQGENIELLYRILRPDGHVRWIHCRGTSADETDGKRCLIGIASDVTRIKELEQRLLRHQASDALHPRKMESPVDLVAELLNPIPEIGAHSGDLLVREIDGPDEIGLFRRLRLTDLPDSVVQELRQLSSRDSSGPPSSGNAPQPLRARAPHLRLLS